MHTYNRIIGYIHKNVNDTENLETFQVAIIWTVENQTVLDPFNEIFYGRQYKWTIVTFNDMNGCWQYNSKRKKSKIYISKEQNN